MTRPSGSCEGQPCYTDEDEAEIAAELTVANGELTVLNGQLTVLQAGVTAKQMEIMQKQTQIMELQDEQMTAITNHCPC